MSTEHRIWPTLSLLRSQEDLRKLVDAAAADRHTVLAPTHIVRQGPDIVGYAGLGSVTVLNTWLDTQRVSPRESSYLLAVAENAAALAGVKRLLLPCSEQSPFHPLIERMGYVRLGTTTLNYKEL
jgi:hypothetical protein